jgi:hypothetical protein
MKKIFLFLFLIFIILLGVYIIKTQSTRNLATIPTTTSTTVAVDNVSITNMIIKEDQDNYIINANYPETNNTFINDDILSLIQSKIDDFKTIISKPSPISSKMTFDINYIIISNKDNILSLKFESESYAGTAHPSHLIFTKNYNIINNTEITFEQVVANDSILKSLSEFAIDYFKNQKFKFVLSLKGLEPNKENYQTFALTSGSAIFYFNENQIAPYTAGSFELKVPYQLFEVESIE